MKCSGTKPVAHPVGLPGAGAFHSAVVASGGDVQGSALLSGVEPPPKEFCLKGLKGFSHNCYFKPPFFLFFFCKI